ncbi:hypothetical protein FA15DRAFT_672511, partial [Coprinopsis marcescibilis]
MVRIMPPADTSRSAPIPWSSQRTCSVGYSLPRALLALTVIMIAAFAVWRVRRSRRMRDTYSLDIENRMDAEEKDPEEVYEDTSIDAIYPFVPLPVPHPSTSRIRPTPPKSRRPSPQSDGSNEPLLGSPFPNSSPYLWPPTSPTDRGTFVRDILDEDSDDEGDI